MLRSLCQRIDVGVVTAFDVIINQNRAMCETRVFYGEDRAEVRRIIASEQSRLLEALTKRLCQRAMANQAAADRRERLMDVRPFFISHMQASKLVKLGDRALSHPAQCAQTGAMWQTSPLQPALDAAHGQCLTMRLRVVGTVAEDALRTIAWCAALTTDRRDRIDQRQQLGHIVGIRAGDDARQRHALRIGDYMVLGAGLATIRRIRSRFSPKEGTHG